MGFLSKIFRKRQPPPFTVVLDGLPTLESVGDVAALVVRGAADLGIELDYSPESLGAIDRILEQLRTSRAPAVWKEHTAVAIGAYFGECMVRNTQGRWKRAAETDYPAEPDWLVVAWPNNRGVCNVLGKPLKFLDEGPDESVEFLYKSVQMQIRGEFSPDELPWESPPSPEPEYRDRGSRLQDE